MAEPRRRRWELLWAPVLYTAVVLVLYREVWLGIGGHRRMFGWDCVESFWPDLSFFAGSLRHGQLPLWNPFDRGGYAFFADPHPGLYYPVTWVFVGLGAILGRVGPWMIQAKALLHLVIAGLTMHAYLRSRKLSCVAAAAGGVAWIVSAPMIIHKASALTWPMVWAPLIWIATDTLVEGAVANAPRWWRRAAALAAAIMICGSAGPPPGFFYILLPSLGYGTLRVLQALVGADKSTRARLAARLALGLGVGAVATFALLAITVVPGLTVVAESTRSVRTLSYSLSNALPGDLALRGLLAPTGGMVDAYGGVLLIVFMLVALASRRRAEPLLFFGMGVFALLLAFGGGTPFLPWLVAHVPGFSLFREANRYKVLANMLFAVVGAYGLEAVLAGGRRALFTLLGACAAVAVGVLVIRQIVHTPHPQHPGSYGLSFAILGIGAFLGSAAILLPRARVIFGIAIVIVSAVDVSIFAAGFVHTLEEIPDDQEDRALLTDLADVTHDWRVMDEFVMEQRPGSRLRVRDFRGYPSGDPFEDQRYHDLLTRAGKNPELLEAFNVRYIFHGPHHRNGLAKNYLQASPARVSPAHVHALDARRFETLHPVPLVAWYGAATIVETPAAALEALLHDEDPAGARHAAIVEHADVTVAVAALPPSSPAASVAGVLGVYEENRIAFTLDAPAAGVVVLNEKSFPGWRVTVDGHAAEPLRVDYLLRGVVVPAGAHTIEWTFHPRRYRLFFALWSAGVLFLLVSYVWKSKKASATSAATTTPPATT